uniref:Uncharacterized protein n=1 Tax=Magallana gigas TaxID=29159 RepID=K1PX01_MAGGI
MKLNQRPLSVAVINVTLYQTLCSSEFYLFTETAERLVERDYLLQRTYDKVVNIFSLMERSSEGGEYARVDDIDIQKLKEQRNQGENPTYSEYTEITQPKNNLESREEKFSKFLQIRNMGQRVLVYWTVISGYAPDQVIICNSTCQVTGSCHVTKESVPDAVKIACWMTVNQQNGRSIRTFSKYHQH